MSEPKIVNLETLPWTRWGTGDGIAVEIRDRALCEAWFKAGR